MEGTTVLTAQTAPGAEGRTGASALSLGRRLYDTGLRSLLWLSAGLTCALLLALIGYILWRGVPRLSWEFLSTAESVRRGTLGILPALANTLYVVAVTLAIALPLGVGAAVYLTEYAQHHRLVEGIEFASETLSGIPSILYALVGYLAFCKTLGLGYSLLAASMTLAMMNLPTIIRTTQESLKTVPQSYREGALGLGSGRWHMIRTVVLPGSIDGIVTGCILAVGRIVGESAVLLYVGGMGGSMNHFFASPDKLIHSSGATLTVQLYVFAKERAMMDPAFAVAVVLLVLTLAINLAAKAAGKKLRQKQ